MTCWPRTGLDLYSLLGFTKDWTFSRSEKLWLAECSNKKFSKIYEAQIHFMQQQDIQPGLWDPNILKKDPNTRKSPYTYIYIYVAYLVYIVTVWPIYPQSLPCVFSNEATIGKLGLNGFRSHKFCRKCANRFSLNNSPWCWWPLMSDCCFQVRNSMRFAGCCWDKPGHVPTVEISF